MLCLVNNMEILNFNLARHLTRRNFFSSKSLLKTCICMKLFGTRKEMIRYWGGQVSSGMNNIRRPMLSW